MSLVKAGWLALYGIEVLVYFRLFTLCNCGESSSNSANILFHYFSYALTLPHNMTSW